MAYEALPPSPTLSNPDMIVPVAASALGAQNIPMKPAPSAADADKENKDSGAVEKQARTKHRMSTVLAMGMTKNALGQVSDRRPASPISPDALDTGAEMDLTPRRPQQHAVQGLSMHDSNTALASSPTLRLEPDTATTPSWPLATPPSRLVPPATVQAGTLGPRRMSSHSTASSSVHSEDLERWKPSIQNAISDTDEDIERKLSIFHTPHLPKAMKQRNQNGNAAGDDTETEDEPEDPIAWPTQHEGESNEDFLSRRAEVILANAKKKLNRMEGHLKGARHSLTVSGNAPSRYSTLGPFPAPNKYRGLSSGQVSHSPGSGHSRAVSEASIPSPVPAIPALLASVMGGGTGLAPTARGLAAKRSSSAMGSYALVGGPSSLDKSLSTSLRGARSQEAMRESRLKSWIMDDRSHYYPPGPQTSSSSPIPDSAPSGLPSSYNVTPPLTSHGPAPRSASSPGYHNQAAGATANNNPLDSPTNSEFSKSQIPRPVSQASSIRAQMSELRDRISELKQRGREKRASMVGSQAGSGARTPSPAAQSASEQMAALMNGGGVGHGNNFGSSPPSWEQPASGDVPQTTRDFVGNFRSGPASRPGSAGGNLAHSKVSPPPFSLRHTENGATDFMEPDTISNAITTPEAVTSQSTSTRVENKSASVPIRRSKKPSTSNTDSAESTYEDAEETLDDLEDSLRERPYLSNPVSASRTLQYVSGYIPPSLSSGMSASMHDPIISDVIEELPELEASDAEEEDIERFDSSGGLNPVTYLNAKQQVVRQRSHQSLRGAFDEEEYVVPAALLIDDGMSVSGATEYYDVESSLGAGVTAERHEDRADAFDYENFFLHSAMGTYSREVRRGERPGSSSSSSSSGGADDDRYSDADEGSVGSVETVRGAAEKFGEDGGNSEHHPYRYDDEDYVDGEDEDEGEEWEGDLDIDDIGQGLGEGRSPPPAVAPLMEGADRATMASAATFHTAAEDVDDLMLDDLDDEDEDAAGEQVLHAVLAQHLPPRSSQLVTTASPRLRSNKSSGSSSGSTNHFQPRSGPANDASTLTNGPDAGSKGPHAAQRISSTTTNPPPTAAPPAPSSSSSGSGGHPALRQASTPTTPNLLSHFVGLDSPTADSDIIHQDRQLVEGVVGALQRACLELQRSTQGGDRRDEVRGLLRSMRLMLEEDERLSARAGGAIGRTRS